MTKPANTETRDALLPCAKCDGKGRLDCFSHYANGACFACKGTGRVLVQDYNWLRTTMATLLGTADIAIDAAVHGNDVRRDHYLRAMLDDMFKVGTENAREILAAVASGTYHDELDGTGYRTARCPIAIARACAARLVELGRERKVAEVEAAAA